MVELRYRVRGAAIAGTNVMVDPVASASAYAEELRAALARELPDARILVEVVADEDPRPTLELTDDPAGLLALRAEGVARAVRHTGRWVVYEEPGKP